MEKRKIRFTPDENNIIELRCGSKITRGLIRDESFNGYCVITNNPFAPNVGDLVEMSINSKSAGDGEIVRVESFDEVLVKVGVAIID